MYRQEYECMYHIFSDNIDEWTPNLKEAKRIYNKWKKEYTNVRLYKETNWDKEEGLFIDEDCLLSNGSFPF